MPNNQWFLTKEGREALERLHQQVYPQNQQPNKTRLKEDTKLTRDTLNKIFNQPYRPVHKRCFVDLFQGLNNKLGENYRKDNQQRRGESKADYELRIGEEIEELRVDFDEDYLTEKNIELRSPRLASSQQERANPSPTSQPSPISQPNLVSGLLNEQSYEEQLATLLGSLNYTTGQAAFIELLSQRHPAGAFLLRVDDTKVQRWLVKRLAEQVPGFENGKRLEINVARLGGNFEFFWSELAKPLGVPHSTAEDTIAHLSDLCQGKTVIIVLSRLQQVDEGMQERLMKEFWLPLARQTCGQVQNWRSRLVLFLVQDGATSKQDSVPPKELFLNQTDSLLHPVMLEPLSQFTSHDVRHWFLKEGFALLATQIGEEAANGFLQRDQISSWQSHPWTILENICNVFQTEITEIEHHWKLAG